MISIFSMATEIGAPLTKPMTDITNGNDRFAFAPASTTAGRQRIQSYLADDSVSADDQMTGAQAPTSSPPGRMLRVGQFLSGPHQG